MLFAYSSYLLADGMRLSGIVSILFCGIVMAHYTFNNLSAKAREFTREMFDVLASISETFVFAYLGMAVFSFKQLFDVKLILITILLILVARAVNVFPISFIVNLTRKTNKIPLKQQLMLWFSGKEKKKEISWFVCFFIYVLIVARTTWSHGFCFGSQFANGIRDSHIDNNTCDLCFHSDSFWRIDWKNVAVA